MFLCCTVDSTGRLIPLPDLTASITNTICSLVHFFHFLGERCGTINRTDLAFFFSSLVLLFPEKLTMNSGKL